MKVDQRHLLEREGVSEVQSRVTTHLKWLFREQPISDRGIDAEIEVLRDGNATGRLLAAQIKSGASYFREDSNDGYVCRGDNEHLEYWLNHALPVIVILWNPETRECVWQHVTEKVVARTANGWKITVPKTQVFTRSSMEALDHVAGIRWDRLTADEAKYLAMRIESFGPNERLHFGGASVFGLTPEVFAQFTNDEQEQFIKAMMAGALSSAALINVVVLRRCSALIASYRGSENDTFRLALGSLLSLHVRCGTRCLSFPRDMCGPCMEFLADSLEKQVHPAAEEVWGIVSTAGPANWLTTRYPSFDVLKDELLAAFEREREVVLSMVREIDGMMPAQLLVVSEPLRSIEDAGVIQRSASTAQAIERASLRQAP